MDITSPRRLKIANWSVMAVLVLTGYVWRGQEFALGVLVGGLVVVVNFHLLASGPERHAGAAGINPREDAEPGQGLFRGRQLLRFFALLAIIFLLVSHGWVNIFGLLVGLSTVVLTLMLAALHETIKLKNKEANPSHGTPHSIS